MTLHRVQKIIANAGYCSRRKAEELIEKGKVAVNGSVITLGDKADPDKDTITVNGKKIMGEKKRYLMLYKPRDILTSLKDPSGKKTILSCLQGVRERVVPVGRLDYDAEGLLLLTNDGDFANYVMHPRYEKVKVYHAELDKKITKQDLQKLTGSIRLRDGLVRIDQLKQLGPNKVEIGVHEGRNKMVKRIFRKLGFMVTRLKRVQVGQVKIGTLKSGELRDLTESEIQVLGK
jgi:23S rRNA pseudouridine2605 synthase